MDNRQEERDAIVAWIRELADRTARDAGIYGGRGLYDFAADYDRQMRYFRHVAERIERGDHISSKET